MIELMILTFIILETEKRKLSIMQTEFKNQQLNYELIEKRLQYDVELRNRFLKASEIKAKKKLT